MNQVGFFKTSKILKRTFWYVALVCVIASSLGPVAPANAAIPKFVNFQGKLTKVSDGTNVTNGTYAFEFKLYDASTSGNLLWTETYDQANGACGKLTVTNAIFNAKLGSCNSLSGVDFTGGSLYLSVNFAPTGTSYDGEMSPRKQLVASPFAFIANGVSGDGKIDIANTGTNQATIGYDSTNKLQVNVGSTGFTTLTANGAGAGFNLTGGNVGIGTSSPAALLQVNSAVGGADALILRDTTNNANARFYFSSPIGSPADLNISAGRVIFPGYAIKTGRIEGNSNLSLGNTNGTVTVDAASAFTVTTTVANTVIFSGGTSADTIIRPYSSSYNIQLAPNGGNVGIGTTSPTALLNVSGAASPSYGQLHINSTATSGNIRSGISLYNQGSPKWTIANDVSGNGTNDFMIFDSSGGGTRFYIGAGGNVGIGTTNPVQKLEVAGNVRVNDASDNQGFIFANGGTDRFKIYQNGTILNFASQSGTLGQTFGFTGGTMDGTTGGHSATLFNVSGAWNQAADTLYGLKLNITDTNSGAASKLLDIQKGGTSQFNVDKNGNVGVGTTTASSNVTVYNATSPTISIYRPNAGTGSPTLNLFVAGSASGNLSFDGTFKLRGGGSGTTEVADFGISSATLYGDLNFGKTTDTAAKIINANMFGTAGGDALLLKTFDGPGALATRFGITGSSNTANAYFTSTNVGIGTTTPGSLFAVGTSSQFTINGSGAITAATGITSSGTITFSGLTAGGVVQATAGTGVLTVGTLGASAITADSLDFAQFTDAMTLDASTDISVTGSNVLSITNSGTGNSLLVNDASGDTSPFVIAADGNVGIGTTSASSTLHVNGDITVSNPSYTGTGFFRQTGNGTTSIGGGPSGLITFGPSNRTFFNDQQIVVPSGGLFAVGSNAVGGNLITVTNALSARTSNANAIGSTSTGTFDTTAGALSSYGGNFSVTSTRSAGANALTNIGLYATASGAQNNYAAIFDAGNVGIGDTSPAALLSVGSGDLFQVNSSGLLFAPDGSASAPAYSFTGDTNTGLYRLGADRLAVTTGGVTRLEVDNNGKLTFFDPVGSVGTVRVADANGILVFQPTSSAYIPLAVKGAASQSADLTQWQNSSGTVLNVVNASGNLGIGTTGPTQKLEVNGNILVNKGTSNRTTYLSDNGLFMSRTSDGSYVSTITADGSITYDTRNDHVFKGDGADIVIIQQSSKSVGIGTTNPDGRLELAGNLTQSAWGLNGIALQGTAATYTDSSTAVSGTATNAVFNSFGIPTLAATNATVTTTNAANVYIAGAPTAGTNQTITNAYSLWVDAGNARFDGNVGIGVTTPIQKLQVLGGVQISRADGNFGSVLTDGGDYLNVTGGIYTPGAIFTGGSYGTFGMQGNFSSRYLDIFAGSTAVASVDGTTKGISIGASYINTAAPTNGLVVEGNVGIGTSTTTASLHVKNIILLEDVGLRFGANTGNSVTNNGSVYNTSGQTIKLFSNTGVDFGNNSSTIYNRIAGNTGGASYFTSGNVGIGTSTPAELLQVAGDIMQQNTRTRTMTRTLTTVVNDAVDIGSFTFSQGAGSLWVSITVPSSGFSVSKEYLLPIAYNQTSNTWTIAPAISSTGSYGGNNFELDVNINNATASLRIRRTAGSTAGTAYIVIQQDGVNTDAFTASTATASVATPTTYFSSTALTQVGGNVGIGTTAPTYKLHLPDPGNTANQANIAGTIFGSDGNGTTITGGSNSTIFSGGSSVYMSGSAKISVGGGTVTTPGSKLSVVGNLAVGSTYATSAAPTDGAIIQGNVGIGTTTAAAKLDVSGTVFSRGNLSVGTNADFHIKADTFTIQRGSSNKILFGNDTVNPAFELDTVAAFGTSDIFAIKEAGTSRFIIDNVGNVGIGTTTAGSLLTVGSTGGFTVNTSGAITAATGITSSGAINFSGLAASSAVYTDGSKNLTSTAPTSGAIGYWSRTGTTLSQATANDVLSVSGNTGDIITITSSATGSANKALNVSQTGATTGTDYAGYFSNTGAATTNIGLYATASGATNNYAAIFDQGNVGIGTTAPGAALVVKHTAGTSGLKIGDGTFATISRNNSTGYLDIVGDSNLNGLYVTLNGSATQRLLLDASGNFSVSGGILTTGNILTNGLNTAYYSNAQGTAGYDAGLMFRNGSTGAKAAIQPNAGKLEFYTNSANTNFDSSMIRMTIDTSGNVGIGTTTPDGRLEIAGNVSASAWGVNGIALQGTAATYTDTSTANSGTATNAAFNSFGIPTLAASNTSVTTTHASTVYIAGPPTAGTNQTITNPYSLLVNSGTTALNGNVAIHTLSQPDSTSLLTVGALNVSNISGTSGTLTGVTLRPSLVLAGNLSALYGQFIHVYGKDDGSARTLTHMYGMFIDTNTKGSNTALTNSYGLYINTQNAGTNNYNIYSESGNNYFAGNIGIGTLTPDAALEIGGSRSQSAWGVNGIAIQGTASTYTDSSTAAAGTATTAAINSTGQSTLNATNSITTTNAYTQYIAGAPISGTNQTLTNTTALYIAGTATTDGAGGTPTNSYGLYVNPQTGATNNYAAVFASGNVGIGTTNPSSVLHIEGSGATTGITLNDSSNGQIPFISFKQAGTTKAQITGGTGLSNRMDFNTGGSSVITLLDSNVGIGTTSPTYKLDVNGTANTVGMRVASNTASDIWYYGTGTVTGDANFLHSAISATGAVQANIANANTTAGDAKVNVQVGGASAGDPYYLLTVPGATNWSIGIDNSDSDKLKIGPVASPSTAGQSLTIQTDGNVGIGTTSAGQALEVGNSGKIRLSRSNTNQSVDLRNNGNDELHVNSNIISTYGLWARSSGTSGAYGLDANTSSGVTQLYSNSNVILTALGTGNVGIGTASPDYALELAGATAPEFALSDTGLAHGVTTWAQTDSFINIEQVTNDDGGARIMGFSDAAGLNPLRFLGVFGATDPTDTTPAIWLLGGKRSGTDVANLGDAETLLQVGKGGDGSSLFTILGNGNVGVGNAAATPVAPLDVVTAAQTVARFKTTGAAHGINIALDSASTYNTNISYRNNGVGKWYEGNDATNDRFRLVNSDANGNAEVFTVLQGGNVGIGTSSPDAFLEYGAAKSASAWGLNGIALQGTAATYTDSSTAVSGTATNAVFNSFGQPTLAASNTGVTTTNAATVYIAAQPTAGTNQTITNAYSLWVDAGNARFDGNVGIGTSDANVALTVETAANNVVNFRKTGNSFGILFDVGANYLTGGASTDASIIQVNNARLGFGTANGVDMIIDSSGNVGIGTTTTTSLLNIGSGTPTTAANGLNFGTDTSANLYRSAAATIKTDGAFVATGSITSSSNVVAGSSSLLKFTNQSSLYSPADGQITLYNNALSDFSLLQFGGASASFPALKRSTTTLQARLANDSGYTAFDAGSYLINGTSINTAGTLNNVAYLNQANTFSTGQNINPGSAVTALAITQSYNAVGINISKAASGAAINISAASAQASGVVIALTDATTSLMNGHTYGVSSVLSTGYDNYSTTAGNFSASQTRTSAGSNGDLAIGVDATASSAIATAGTYGYAGRFTAGSANVTALLVKGAASQTSDIFQIQNSGGTGLVTVNSAGNVGIGTTTPAAKLEVSSSVYAKDTLIIDRPSGTIANYFQIISRGAAVASNFGNAVGNGATELSAYSTAGIIMGTIGAQPVVFGTSNSERMRIDASGNVGIGTSAPAALLHMRSDTAQITFTNIANATTATIVPTSGSLIISASGAGNGILFGNSDTYIGPVTNGSMDLGSTGQSRRWRDLYLTRDAQIGGNVGIGTTAPSALLDVYNSGDSILAADNTSDGQVRIKATGVHSQALTLTPRLGSATLFPTGGAGIGIQASSEFAIAATTGLSLSGGGTTSDLRITTTGNVGIGTATPVSQLHIEKNTTTSPELTISSDYGSNYHAGALVFKSLATAGDRALGTFYHDAVGDTEWFSGRPYDPSTLNDKFVIGRIASVTDHSRSASDVANALLTVGSNGNVGIGTTGAVAKLQISSGSIQLDNNQYLKGKNTVATAINLIGTSSDNYIELGSATVGTVRVKSSAITFRDSGNTYDIAAISNSADQIRIGGGNQNYVDIYSHTTQIARFNSSGTYFVNSNVGVGTTSPDATLEVAGSKSQSAWGLNGIALQGTAATYTDSSTAVSGTATNAVFNSFGIPTLAATNATVTTTNAANVYIAGAPTAGTNQTITNAYSLWVDDGTARFDGNVGIGTTTPTALLHVKGADTSSATKSFSVQNSSAADGLYTTNDSYSYLGKFAEISDNTVYHDSTVAFSVSSNAKTYLAGFYDGGTARLIVKRDGNVGVGTASPIAKFQVEQNSIYANAVQSDTILTGTGTEATANLYGSDGYWGIRTATNNSFNLDVYNGGGGNQKAALTVLQAGNVGIGTTSPAGKLDVVGGAALFGTASGDTYISGNSINGQYATNANGILYLNYTGYQAGTTQFRDTQISDGKGAALLFVDGSANSIGIGTTTPFSGATVASSLELGTFNGASADGNLIVRGYAALGGKSKSSYGAVGSNYYVDSSNALRAKNSDFVSVLEFPGGGFSFQSAGNTAANTTPTLATLATLNSSGNFGIGDTSPAAMLTVGNGDLFQVNSSGAIAAAAGITSSGTITFSGLTAGGVVQATAGTGVLTVGTLGASAITADVLDFAQMADAMTLDASTDISVTGSNVLSITNSGTGNSLLVNDASGDTSPFVIDAGGNVGIGSTAPGAKLDVVSSATTGIGQLITASSITTGQALSIVGPTSTGVTGSGLLKVAGDVGSAGTQGILAQFLPDFSAGSATSGYGLAVVGTDNTSIANSDTNFYSNLTLTGNAAKNGYASYNAITTSSTTADNTYAGLFSTTASGAISTGTRNTFGVFSNPSSTGANTGGTTQVFGGYFVPSSTGSTTGSTVNVFGAHIQNTATLTTNGTITSYGLYISNGSMNTTGTSTQYGLYVTPQTGADANYAAYFGGNVGIGTTTPSVALHAVGNTNAATGFQLDFDGFDGGAYNDGLYINSTDASSYFARHIKLRNGGYNTNGYVYTGDFNGLYFDTNTTGARYKFRDVSGSFVTIDNADSVNTLKLEQADSKNSEAIYIDAEESTTTQSLFSIQSDTSNGSGADTVKFKITADGSVYSDANVYSTPADVAEMYYDVTGDLEAGELVELGTYTDQATGEQTFGVHRMTNTSNQKPFGVISTKPGPVLGYDWKNPEILAKQKPVALVGRVPVKVTLENGPIKRGDQLTNSPTQPGFAAKAIARGYVIGQALEDFDGTNPEQTSVLVFVDTDKYSPTVAELLQTTTATNQQPSELLTALSNLNMQQAEVFGDIAVNGTLYVQKDLHVQGVLYAMDIRSEKVTTKELCLEDVCINKNQLQQILQLLQSSNTSGGTPPSGTVAGESDTGGNNETTPPPSEGDTGSSSEETPPQE